MTRTDMPRAALLFAILMAVPPATHAQTQGAIGRSTARAIAARSTTSAARTASSLSTLGSGSSVASSRATSVMGYLWAGEGTPISDATVQLRNIVTGQIEQVSTTLNNGAFAFNNVQSGTYAIEYMSESAGRLVAVGQAFSVAPGETVATFVRLGSELAGTLTGAASTLAGNAAQAVISTAASAGIAGTIAPDQPASALR